MFVVFALREILTFQFISARTSSEARTLTAFAELLGSLLIGIQEYEPMAQRVCSFTVLQQLTRRV